MTTHDRYRGLRNRFNRRAALLVKLGFRYQRIEEFNIAVFTRDYFPKGTRSIPAETLHHASNACWNDRLCEVLRTA